MFGPGSLDRILATFVQGSQSLFFPCVAEVKGAVGQIIAQDKLILAVEQNKTLIPPTYQRFLAWGFADQRCAKNNCIV